jgi:hypothetical protein
MKDLPHGQTQYDPNEKETFEAMVRRLHTKLPMATQEDALEFATRIRDELRKGQEPVACTLAITYGYGDFCQCKKQKLYLYPAPIPADMALVPRIIDNAMMEAALENSREMSRQMLPMQPFTDVTWRTSVQSRHTAMIAACEKEQG